jgi:hypothetical protein
MAKTQFEVAAYNPTTSVARVKFSRVAGMFVENIVAFIKTTQAVEVGDKFELSSYELEKRIIKGDGGELVFKWLTNVSV